VDIIQLPLVKNSRKSKSYPFKAKNQINRAVIMKISPKQGRGG
jgi:hypothetical protein